MEDVFKPHSLTVKSLFGNPDALYQIPRYQRPYSWGDEQLDKLWADLREAQELEPNYFLGSIITAKPEGASNYLDVVDGQQRLTTLLILLCVYRDLYPEINQQLLETDVFAIDANIIKSSIRYNDRFERLRLKTHSNHESDFQNMILKDGQSIKNTRPYKKDLKKEESPVHKFKNTAAFFIEKLEELGEIEAGVFVNYLFNKVKIIRIDCHDVGFAIKLFQVLNDRGLDLSNSDLIKSYLIGKIHKIYGEDNELKKRQEDQFMDDWKLCENVAMDTEENMNNLFVLYEYSLLGKNPEKSLYDELVKLFEKEDPNDIISKFKKFVTNYKNHVYNRKDAIMYGFYYFRWTMYWRSIVLTALDVQYKEYELFLKVFKRYYYLNWIAGNTLSKIKQTSFNIIAWLRENKPLQEIKDELEKNIENETIERAISNLNGDIYYEAWCKPLLFMIEYNQEDNPIFYSMSNRNIHTEHILPQGYAKNKDWAFYNNLDYIDEWINSGANLTLLSGLKNISASNDGFHTKIIAYDGRGHHEKNDDKITSFTITQKVVNDYHSSKFNKEWNIYAINNRWEWFCNEVEKILEIDLTSIKKNLLT